MRRRSPRRHARILRLAFTAATVAAFWTQAVVLHAAERAASGDAVRPAGDDHTAGSLQRYQRALLARYGGNHRAVPLDVKADYFEWALVRYHLAPYDQVHTRVILPEKAGEPPDYYYGEDNSTWNGALLAALSFKYAATKDPATLRLICRLLDGMHLFQEVTGKPGLAARCVLRRDEPFAGAKQRYVASDGTVYHVRCDPAKGTYNQVVAGYATLMMHAYDDLPEKYQRLAHDDLTALVLHVIDHNYRLTAADGKLTTYGDLTPLIGPFGVPFNAQVAYMIVATGAYFPPDDPAKAARIRRAFKRLRKEHHVYYENPLTHLVCPQRVADNPLVKGMNDRNHVMNAAFIGLALEIDSARKQRRKADGEFLYELGRTMFWGMNRIQFQHNALCNVMWAGLLSDPKAFRRIVPKAERDRTRRQLAYVTAAGVEQLRRFPIDRFYYPGREVETRETQWIDARERHNSYHWKSDPFTRWKITGPVQNTHTCSIDYLYAYWVMRFYGLEPPKMPE